MKRVPVRLGRRSYDVLIGTGLYRQIVRTVERLGLRTPYAVITNRRVLASYGRKIVAALRATNEQVAVITVPDSERAKSLAELSRVIKTIAGTFVKDAPTVVAVGGGVVGDLAGFVAAVYRRGVAYIQVPTTLLAQVDSSIGGKTAVDIPAAKNMIGAFHQPSAVIADIDALKTLSRRQIASGFSEIIKYAVIGDPGLFRYLERHMDGALSLDTRILEHIITRCASMKASIVSRDEHDRKGRRVVLNLGHTIGHAIETATSYTGKYNHGEAVALGMIAACHIADAVGILEPDDAARIRALVAKAGLPVEASGVSASRVMRSYHNDKKFLRGKNRLVLPAKIGGVRIVEGVPEEIVRAAIRGIGAR